MQVQTSPFPFFELIVFTFDFRCSFAPSPFGALLLFYLLSLALIFTVAITYSLPMCVSAETECMPDVKLIPLFLFFYYDNKDDIQTHTHPYNLALAPRISRRMRKIYANWIFMRIVYVNLNPFLVVDIVIFIVYPTGITFGICINVYECVLVCGCEFQLFLVHCVCAFFPFSFRNPHLFWARQPYLSNKFLFLEQELFCIFTFHFDWEGEEKSTTYRLTHTQVLSQWQKHFFLFRPPNPIEFFTKLTQIRTKT